jgi:hypothetical protein
MQLRTLDYVGGMNFLSLFHFKFTYFLSPTHLTPEPICMHDGLNDAVCFKEVPFGV